MAHRTAPALATFVLLVGLFGTACSSTPPETAPCSPATCSGCCTPDGTCEPGTTEVACGTAGSVCSVCIANQSCVAQTCVLVIGDGGIVGEDAGVISDAGTDSDGGTEVDGGTDTDGGTVTDGGAIVAANETWTWVDFPGAVCGNGTMTGLGVNLTQRSDDVLIYMEGGGACWNATTCFTFGTAANLSTGYDGADFANAAFRQAFAVDRSQSTNPFRDLNYVYIPYCTGDVHGGDAIQKYDPNRHDVHHKGVKNVEAYLARLSATFPNATKVFLTGSSAGAYGAQLNYERVAAAFPNAEVHVLADSGQMVNPSGSLLTTWLNAWKTPLPAGCPACATDFTAYPEYLATTYPNRRFGLLAYDQDNVLRQFLGYSAADFQMHTLALLSAKYDPYSNAKYFLLSGTQHTMLGSLSSITAPNGTTLNSFVTGWVENDGGFSNVKP